MLNFLKRLTPDSLLYRILRGDPARDIVVARRRLSGHFFTTVKITSKNGIQYEILAMQYAYQNPYRPWTRYQRAMHVLVLSGADWMTKTLYAEPMQSVIGVVYSSAIAMEFLQRYRGSLKNGNKRTC